MRKILLFGLVVLGLFSNPAFTRPLTIDREKCPKNIVCETNEILGDDGKCYACVSKEKIEISCIGWEKAKKSCPNRLLGHPAHVSYLTCPEGTEIFKGHEGSCLHKCEEGFDGIEEFMCKNKKTGESYFVDY